MCLTVVAVVVMLVVGQGSATATVEESATAAAEEADDGQDIAPQNSEIASKKGFRQKRNVFLSIPLRSVPLFLVVPAKKERSSFFSIPDSCGFRGILWITVGMHNLVCPLLP
jgi:hypothetical protein